MEKMMNEGEIQWGRQDKNIIFAICSWSANIIRERQRILRQSENTSSLGVKKGFLLKVTSVVSICMVDASKLNYNLKIMKTWIQNYQQNPLIINSAAILNV